MKESQYPSGQAREVCPQCGRTLGALSHQCSSCKNLDCGHPKPEFKKGKCWDCSYPGKALDRALVKPEAPINSNINKQEE